MIDILVEVIFILTLLGGIIAATTVIPPSDFTIPSVIIATVIAAMQSGVQRMYIDSVEWAKFSLGGIFGGITMCTYGYSGSGKTTFIKSTFTLGLDPKGRERSTKKFKWYRFEPMIAEEDKLKKISIRIADYQGQRPSDLILKNRLTLNNVSSLVFLVDVVGRRYLKEGTELIDADENIIKWLSDDPENKIKSRIEDHQEVINDGLLEILFTRVENSKLNSVVLIINKFDIIQELRSQGIFLAGKDDDELKFFVRKLFSNIENKINKACCDWNLGECKTFIISTNNRGDTQDVFSYIYERHKRQSLADK